MAKQRAFITSLVGDGPCDRRIFEAIGRDLDRGPDYVYVFNILNQMGILADVTFVANGDNNKTYADIDEAVKDLHWMLNNLTAKEESRLRAFLEKNFVQSGNGWALSYKHTVRWAVISWKKPPINKSVFLSGVTRVPWTERPRNIWRPELRVETTNKATVHSY